MSDLDHSNGAIAPPLASRQASRRPAPDRARENPNRNRPEKFRRQLQNKKVNRFIGESPGQIILERKPGETRQIVRNAALDAGYTSAPTLQVYGYALYKLKDLYASGTTDRDLQRSIDSMSVTDFAQVVACDDLLSVALDAGKSLYHLAQRPAVRSFVGGLLRKGHEKFGDWLNGYAPSTASRDSDLSMGSSSSDGVSLGHVFSCLTESVPCVSDPADIPKAVYTNRMTTSFTQVVNATGGLFLKLVGARFANTGFYTINNATGYDPDSGGVTGTYTLADGPLRSSNTSFSRTKIEGFEIEISPLASLNSVNGAYVAGFLTDDTSSGLPFGSQTVLTFTAATQLPFFRVCDMKTKITSRMYPTTDPSVTQWEAVGTTNIPDYSSFFIIVKGASASVSLNFRMTIVYSILPSLAAQNLIRGKIPSMGPYTDIFCEWLRVRYPDIIYWPSAAILALYRKFTELRSTSYTELIKINHEYQHEHQNYQGGEVNQSPPMSSAPDEIGFGSF